MDAPKTTIIKPRGTWYLVDPRELWNYRELFLIFIWRDIAVRYKQTFIGILWVVLQPLVSMVIFTVFFGNIAKIPSGNLPYAVFVLIGLIYWNLFSTSLLHAANSFIDNTAILGKVYFPREILPLAAVSVSIVDFFVSFILFLVISLFMNVTLTFPFMIVMFVSLLITIISSSGLGLFLASVNVKYRDVRYILPYFLQLMLFVTPIIYPLNIVRPSFQRILSLNPLTGVIDSLRITLSTGEWHLFPLVLSSFAAVLLLFFGFVYFRKTQAFFADLL